MTFANDTTVPVERSKAEIERLLGRHGAARFMSGWDGDTAVIGFVLGNRTIRFTLPLPAKTDRQFHRTPTGRQRRNPADAEHEAKVEAWEAEATRISIHCGVAMQLVQRMRDDGASLMRARPAATERDTAAGELLRAAKIAREWVRCAEDYDDLCSAIEAFERAGVKP